MEPTLKDIPDSLEEPRYVSFEYRQSYVSLLPSSYNCIIALHVQFGKLNGALRVEGSEKYSPHHHSETKTIISKSTYRHSLL